jgi:hypothetical protein
MPVLTSYSRWAIALICGTLLAACATLIGPRQLELPQSKLQQSLERKFPVHQRMLGIFELELSHRSWPSWPRMTAFRCRSMCR